VIDGLRLIVWAWAYNTYNRVANPSRRWKVDCGHCEERHTARSYNGVVLKNSLHIAFTDDHPDPPDYGGHDVPSEEPTKVVDV